MDDDDAQHETSLPLRLLLDSTKLKLVDDDEQTEDLLTEISRSFAFTIPFLLVLLFLQEWIGLHSLALHSKALVEIEDRDGTWKAALAS